VLVFGFDSPISKHPTKKFHWGFNVFAAAKADAEARKRQEKAALLAQEEAALGAGGKPKPTSSIKKANGGKKDDLSLLLVHAAEKTSRQKKQAELEKKRKEELAAQERAAKEKEALDPLMQNTNMMLEGAVGREGNVQAMEETLSGLDGALQTLNISVPGGDVKSQRALHMAFEEKMLPIVKADFPGLRLSQYKEKIFTSWKKSPENPQNQILE
jgi:Coiled-coil domain-containing protein 124 /Oxs1